MWLGFTAMLSLKWKPDVKESSENKKPGKKSLPQEEVAKQKVEGQSLLGSLLPPEAAAARDAPSFTMAHHPPAPLGGLGLLLFTPVPLLSPRQETKCPFARIPRAPLAWGGKPPLSGLLPSPTLARGVRSPSTPAAGWGAARVLPRLHDRAYVSWECAASRPFCTSPLWSDRPAGGWWPWAEHRAPPLLSQTAVVPPSLSSFLPSKPPVKTNLKWQP